MLIGFSVEHVEFFLDSLDLLLECVLSNGLSLNGLEFNLRVNLCLPHLYVNACSQQYSSLAIEASG